MDNSGDVPSAAYMRAARFWRIARFVAMSAREENDGVAHVKHPELSAQYVLFHGLCWGKAKYLYVTFDAKDRVSGWTTHDAFDGC